MRGGCGRPTPLSTSGHIAPRVRDSLDMPNGEAGYLRLMGSAKLWRGYQWPWLCGITSAFDCSSCVLQTHVDSLLTTSLRGKKGVGLLASLDKHIR